MDRLQWAGELVGGHACVGQVSVAVGVAVLPESEGVRRIGCPDSDIAAHRAIARVWGLMSRRLLAIVALVVAAATILLALWVVVSEFPRGLMPDSMPNSSESYEEVPGDPQETNARPIGEVPRRCLLQFRGTPTNRPQPALRLASVGSDAILGKIAA